ncbi:MAG: EthD domain-containing protein [Gemmatimonadota bacterium]
MEAKLVICHRLAQSRERSSIQAAWRHDLGPPTLALQEELGFTRYSQVHSVSPGHLVRRVLLLSRTRIVASLVALTTGHRTDTPRDGGAAARGGAERWDVVDEFWWPSVEDLLAAATSKTGIAALSRLRRMRAPYTQVTAAAVCRELIVAAPRAEQPGTARVSFCLRPRPRDTPAEMQSYWRKDHTALVQSMAETLGFDQYDLAPTVLDDPRADVVIDALGGSQSRPYVGFASLSYPTIRDVTLQFLRPTVQMANFKLMQDELAFIDPPACSPVLGTRVPIV